MNSIVPYREIEIVNNKNAGTPKQSWWERLKTWWRTPWSKVNYRAHSGEIYIEVDSRQLNHNFSLKVDKLTQFNSWLQKQPDDKDCMIVGAAQRLDEIIPWFAVPKLKKAVQNLVQTYERATTEQEEYDQNKE